LCQLDKSPLIIGLFISALDRKQSDHACDNKWCAQKMGSAHAANDSKHQSKPANQRRDECPHFYLLSVSRTINVLAFTN